MAFHDFCGCRILRNVLVPHKKRILLSGFGLLGLIFIFYSQPNHSVISKHVPNAENKPDPTSDRRSYIDSHNAQNVQTIRSKSHPNVSVRSLLDNDVKKISISLDANDVKSEDVGQVGRQQVLPTSQAGNTKLVENKTLYVQQGGNQIKQGSVEVGKITPKKQNMTSLQNFSTTTTTQNPFTTTSTKNQANHLEDIQALDKNMKTILLWGQLYNSKAFFLDSVGQQPFHDIHCPVTNCNVSTDLRMLIHASAVVFPMIKSRALLPSVRYRNQLYVQVTIESPGYVYNRFPNMDDTMNITMTYRRDSDLFWAYFLTTKLDTPRTSPFKLSYDLQKRNKSVVWLVSNCYSMIQRELYVSQLKKHIHVDIIGNCGDKNACPPDDMDNCIKRIAAQYNFYLSFENSYCQDYITEKAYVPLAHEMLPIVLGGTNYTRDMPPHSFIDIFDYKSPKDLAKYLQYLSSNDTAYMEYFHWHNDYRVYRPGTPPSFCGLCQMLNSGNYTKTYPNFKDWWAKDKCKENVLRKVLSSDRSHSEGRYVTLTTTTKSVSFTTTTTSVPFTTTTLSVH